MKLVYFYNRWRAGNPGAIWRRTRISDNRYVHELEQEGPYYLFCRMLEEGIIDELFVVIESSESPGMIDYGNGVTGVVVPEISDAWSYIQPHDVIYIRGGFKSWHDTLVELSHDGHWLLCYAANTGRERWPFWHVIFNDLSPHFSVDRQGRFNFYYKKPTHPQIFRPSNDEPVYDVCIGASHIHDKKGQWLGVQALAKHYERHDLKLKCVLPGGMYRGAKTGTILPTIQSLGLDVELPGMLHRHELSRVLARTKLFIHFGPGGQNDRGPLEAMRCGTPVMLNSTGRHAPFIAQCGTNLVLETNKPETLADGIELMLQEYSEERRKQTFAFHERLSGIEDVILPEMDRLFRVIRRHPIANRAAYLPELCAEFGVEYK